MRLGKPLLGFLVIAVASTTATTGVAEAGDIQDGSPGGGATVAVEAAVSGFETPAGVFTSPCAGDEVYSQFVSARDDRRFKNETFEFFDSELPAAESQIFQGRFAMYDGSTLAWVDAHAWSTPVKTHVWWTTSCQNPETGEISPAGEQGFWVPLVSQETVIPALYERLEDYLTAPVLSWPSEDPEFGWLYVKAPMDFRIAPPNGVSLTATVTNVTGSVTATLSAEPGSVTFTPGEPDGDSVVCSVAAATAEYSDASPGACSYTYQNSSAISPWAEFSWRAVLRWDVTTSSPTFAAASIPTVSYGTVAVAEAQAVVTG